MWPSSVSLYFVARLAGERVKVVLTGEGSDETLGGLYPLSLDGLECPLGPRVPRVYAVSVNAAFDSRAAIDSDRLPAANAAAGCEHTFLGARCASWSAFYFDNFYCCVFGSRASQSSSRTRCAHRLVRRTRDVTEVLGKFLGRSLLDRLLYTDIKTYLVELCMKQDQMSMAASIESRVPFLDHVLVEFALSIPASLKTRGLTGKRILKTVMKKSLPNAILNRQKLGFPTPYSEWLSGSQVDIVKDLLLEERTLSRGLFKPERVERLFAEHRTNLRDNSDKLWRLLNLEIWHRVFVDRDPNPLNIPRARHSLASG